jgi:hypothetical protein
LRRYWTGSAASSLCTVLPTRCPFDFSQDRPFGRLRSGFPFRFVVESGQASLNSPEVSTTVSRGGCMAIQPAALPTELPGNLVQPKRGHSNMNWWGGRELFYKETGMGSGMFLLHVKIFGLILI